MLKIIGLKDLREKTQDFIAQVQRGESFIVVRRSKPIFKVSPPDEESELWEPVVDFTQISKKGVPLREILKQL